MENTRNEFKYKGKKGKKHFSLVCDDSEGYSFRNEKGYFDEDNPEKDYLKFNETINNIYEFTIDNLETILDKGLKYPTDYFSERCNYLRSIKSKGLINTIDGFENIKEIYISLFNKPREELVNYYLNDILLYQYDKRLGFHKYNDKTHQYDKYSHDYLLDLDTIVDKYGIYRLYDDNEQLMYIGKSYKLGTRIQTSLKNRKCDHYDYCILETKEQADVYEVYYISKLKPKYNVTDINTDISEFKLDELVFTDIKNYYPLCIDNNKPTNMYYF